MFRIGLRMFPVAMCLVLAAAWGEELPDGRLVDLNVVALDGHGQPVNDLTAADFDVSDAGKPRTIGFFHRYGRTLRKLTTLGPNEYSNRGGGNIPHATVILFDLMNESFGTRGNANSQLERYLQSLENADYLYLYMLTLDGRIFAVHGLPGLEGEVHKPDEAPWTRQIKPMLDEAMNAVTRLRPVELDIAARVQVTFRALNLIAAQLSLVPGRKNIVWITDGVPITLGPNRSDTGDYVDFTPQIRQLSEALSRTGVAVYPVQQILPGSGDTSGGTGFGSGVTLDSFANLTGGRRDQGKDIGPAIQQAMNDARSSYQLGYYLPEKDLDGKFHKLRVTCKRKGVRIQTRTAYYAWADPADDDEKAIVSAGSTAFDAAEIGLVASLSNNSDAAHSVHLEARIDGSDIVWVPMGTKSSASLRVAVIGYLENGQAVNSALIPLDVSDAMTEYERDVQQGIRFAQDVKVEDEVKSLRFVVIDQKSRAVGTVTVPIKSLTPNPSR